MPGLGFSGANLATVAYAEVEGTSAAGGSSTTQNSGVTTTRVALGTYVVVLPTTLAQPSGRDIILVTPRANADGSGVAAKNFVLDDTLDCTKTVTFFSGDPALGGSTRIDSSFGILILRTTINPPSGSPA